MGQFYHGIRKALQISSQWSNLGRFSRNRREVRVVAPTPNTPKSDKAVADLDNIARACKSMLSAIRTLMIAYLIDLTCRGRGASKSNVTKHHDSHDRMAAPHLFWSPPSGALLARQAMRWHAHHKLVARARKLLCRQVCQVCQVCQCSHHWQSDCHRAIVPQWCHSDQSENSYVPSLLTAQREVCGRDMKMADPLAESNGQIRDVQNPCKRGVSAELQCKLEINCGMEIN